MPALDVGVCLRGIRLALYLMDVEQCAEAVEGSPDELFGIVGEEEARAGMMLDEVLEQRARDPDSGAIRHGHGDDPSGERIYHRQDVAVSCGRGRKGTDKVYCHHLEGARALQSSRADNVLGAWWLALLTSEAGAHPAGDILLDPWPPETPSDGGVCFPGAVVTAYREPMMVEKHGRNENGGHDYLWAAGCEPSKKAGMVYRPVPVKAGSIMILGSFTLTGARPKRGKGAAETLIGGLVFYNQSGEILI